MGLDTVEQDTTVTRNQNYALNISVVCQDNQPNQRINP